MIWRMNSNYEVTSMDDRVKFTATVVVGDKFNEVFNSIAGIPLYHNCGRIVNTKFSRLMLIILTPRTPHLSVRSRGFSTHRLS